MAEREGFEPSIELPLYQFSRLARSTTLPPLRALLYIVILSWLIKRLMALCRTLGALPYIVLSLQLSKRFLVLFAVKWCMIKVLLTI